jgi:hypothetical protein
VQLPLNLKHIECSDPCGLHYSSFPTSLLIPILIVSLFLAFEIPFLPSRYLSYGGSFARPLKHFPFGRPRKFQRPFLKEPGLNGEKFLKLNTGLDWRNEQENLEVRNRE